ncbi:potassium channel family protein [Halobacillus sp. MO56]
MANFLFGATIVFIAANRVYFFTNKTYRKSKFSTALFLKLFFVLTGVLVGFAFLYYVLSLNEVVLVENIKSRKPVDPTFPNLLYFSGVTLLTIGYGDIVPIGVARFFAVLESSIGVLLPTAYFMKALVSSNCSNDDQ